MTILCALLVSSSMPTECSLWGRTKNMFAVTYNFFTNNRFANYLLKAKNASEEVKEEQETVVDQNKVDQEDEPQVASQETNEQGELENRSRISRLFGWVTGLFRVSRVRGWFGSNSQELRDRVGELERASEQRESDFRTLVQELDEARARLTDHLVERGKEASRADQLLEENQQLKQKLLKDKVALTKDVIKYKELFEREQDEYKKNFKRANEVFKLELKDAEIKAKEKYRVDQLLEENDRLRLELDQLRKQQKPMQSLK